MQRRQLLFAGLAGLGLSLVGYAVFSPASDEEKAAATLHELARAVSFESPQENPLFFGNLLAARFDDLLGDTVRITIPEVHAPLPEDPGQLAVATAQVLSRYARFEVSLGALQFEPGDKPIVHADVTVLANVHGELRRGERRVDFTLERTFGGFRVLGIAASRERD